jgi:phospholipid/cholesterol/gamma-HCH transport system substrate-binding protein
MAPRRHRTNIYRRRAQGIGHVWRASAGIVTVLFIAAFIYLAETAQNGIPFKSYRTVNVSLPNIGHLQAHDSVRIAGVYVGQVQSIGTSHNQASVKLQLSGVGPLPVNSHAIVRGFGLLGARYLELDPGTSRTMLANGGTLIERNPVSSYTWGIPEALNLFDAKTRNALGYMWRGFGTGLEGRGQQLNSAIHVGPPSGQSFDQAAYAILARPGAAQSFLGQMNSGWSALNSTGTNLTGAMPAEATVAQAFIDTRAATEALIQEFPIAERNIDAGFAPGVGPTFWNSVTNLSGSLATVLPQLPNALRQAVSFLKNTQAPLRNTKPLLNEVPQAVPPTLAILSSLKPDLSPLHQAFTSLVNPVTQLALHGCDIQSFATGTRSLVNFGTVPGGSWGPDVGFPVGVILAPHQMLNSYANTHQTFADTSGYYAPCAFAPGVTIDSSTLTGILSGLLGPK